jgi:hypothetical protein
VDTREKTERVACTKEHEYMGGKGDTIRWVCQEIEAIHSLLDREFEEGTEMYWELFHRVDKATGEGEDRAADCGCNGAAIENRRWQVAAAMASADNPR